jgi:tetratricopeptide (TPR) repeat protein
MIIDNVDDPSMNLFPLLPKARHGHIIVTSRDSTRLGLANPPNRHLVGDLDERASVELLLRLSSYPPDDANIILASQIAAELGYLPLALAHASVYISIHGGMSSYLETYRQSRKKMLEHLPPGLPSDYNLAVAATIEMSVRQLPQRTRDILHLLSHFQVASVTEAIIVRAAEKKFAHMAYHSSIRPPVEMLDCADALMRMFCPSGRWSQHDFNQLIQPCLQYSLLQKRESEKMGRYFSMHPLVQSWLRLQAQESMDQSNQDLFIRLLASSITIGEPFEHLGFNQILRPHIQSLDEKSVKCIGDKHSFETVLYENGDYSRALDYVKSCLEEEEKVLGEGHRETMGSIHKIALRYADVGKNTEALEMGMRAVELRQKILGNEHPETLGSMQTLSIHYSQVGRHAEALEMGAKAMGLYQKILSNEHPETLRSMDDMSVHYSKVGRYAEALENGVKTMTLCQKIMGSEHPYTLRSMHNVSIRYSKLGEHAEALEMGLKVMGLYEKILGEEHPDTLRSMADVSFYYSMLGKHDEALHFGLNALTSFQRVLGSNHPFTQWSLRHVENLRSIVCSRFLGSVS